MTTARYILGFSGGGLSGLRGDGFGLGGGAEGPPGGERRTGAAAERPSSAAGLASPDEDLSEADMAERFAPVRAVVVDLETGEELPEVDPASVDPLVEAGITDSSRAAPENLARIRRVERRSVVYLVESGGELDAVVLPVRGQGPLVLSSTAIWPSRRTSTRCAGSPSTSTRRTPGLGGEVDNPNWKALWPGRRVFGTAGEPIIEVARAAAGPVAEDPHRVDGLAGATMTSRGVTNLLRFWLAENGFGPFLTRLAAEVSG